jgi:hypothetical protein
VTSFTNWKTHRHQTDHSYKEIEERTAAKTSGNIAHGRAGPNQLLINFADSTMATIDGESQVSRLTGIFINYIFFILFILFRTLCIHRLFFSRADTPQARPQRKKRTFYE